MGRNFNEWLSTFTENIAGYNHYTDFKKVYMHVDKVRKELNLINSLINSKNIESDFEDLINEYPKVLKCIPILLAVREMEIYILEEKGPFIFNFKEMNYSIEDYKKFMRETGLFDLLENHIISNIFDYITGVEVGLDSNARKNRTGQDMEDLIELYIKQAGFVEDKNYFKQMSNFEVERRWNVDLSSLSNDDKTKKRFDFVVKTDKKIYLIETNFYTGQGSKLNETARSYKTLALEAKDIDNIEFVWFTDGKNGWNTAKHNLEETFDIMENLYNLNDIKNGIMKTLFK